MVNRAGSGRWSGGLGRGPGWFSRSPVMARLASTLWTFQGLLAVQRLSTFLSPAAGLAKSILARFAAREPVHALWHGRLHLDRQVISRKRTAQPVFRSLVERWNKKGKPRRAFQTLSLPEGVLDEIAVWDAQSGGEEDAGLTTGWSPDAEGAEVDTGQPYASGLDAAAAADAGISRAQAEYASLIPPSLRQFSGREQERQVFAQRRQQRDAGGSLPPVKWPHRLVTWQREDQAGGILRGEETRAPGWTFARQQDAVSGPAIPAVELSAQSDQLEQPAQPDRLEHPAGRELALVPGSKRQAAAAVSPHLEARQMTLLQPRMPVSAIRIPAAGVETRRAADRLSMEMGSLSTAETRRSSVLTLKGRTTHALDLGGAVRTGTVPRKNELPGSGMTTLRPAGTMLHLSEASPGAVQPVTMKEEDFGRSEEREWPLFGVLRRLESRLPETEDSSALQHLRRMWPDSQAGPAVRRALESSAGLGPGEVIAPELRREMEAHLGRDLGEVRLHTSPIAQALRAEAFTSGRHIVFAPGRHEPGTGRGLSLLGHELAHLGQPLAFKIESGAGAPAEDSQESAARQQEDQVQQVFEKGWPKRNATEYRRPVQSGSQGTAISMVQRAVEIDELTVEPSQREQSVGSQRTDPGGTAGAGQRTGTAAGPAVNLDTLARQVYGILKERLRSERNRHELYGR